MLDAWVQSWLLYQGCTCDSNNYWWPKKGYSKVLNQNWKLEHQNTDTQEKTTFFLVVPWHVSTYISKCTIWFKKVYDIQMVLGLQRYTGVSVHRDIFCHDRNIVYWTSYRDINDTFTSTNMGKHCLQLVLTLLLLFSPYALRFYEQTDEKNPCWAVFSIMFKMADTRNACVLPCSISISCLL